MNRYYAKRSRIHNDLVHPARYFTARSTIRERSGSSWSLFHGKKHNSGTVWFILVVISRQEAQFGNGLVHPGRYFTARSTIRERSGSSWSLFHGKKHNSGTVWFILVVISRQEAQFGNGLVHPGRYFTRSGIHFRQKCRKKEKRSK